MSNINSFIYLDRILKFLSHGRVSFDAKIKDGEIKTLIVEGNKSNLYNRTGKDINDNEKAFKFILNMIFEVLKSEKEERLDFTIYCGSGKIKKIEFRKQYQIVIDSWKK